MLKKEKQKKQKQYAVLILLLSLSLGLISCGNGRGAGFDQEEVNTDLRGHNLFVITTAKEFEAGELDNLTINKEIGDGAIAIRDGLTEGTFTSPVYSVDDFEFLTASWSAFLPENTSISVYARYREAEKDVFSTWYSWGTYSTTHRCSSIKDVEESINSIKVDALQFRATLKKTSPDAQSPIIRQLTFTSKGDDTIVKYEGEELTSLPKKVAIKAPSYSQEIRQPSIADSICSPTSVSVMLNSRNPSLNVLPEEIAITYIDDSYGFGNWAYSSSAMGQYGYNVMTQYGDLNVLLQELAKGNTSVLSVKYTPGTPRPMMPHLAGSYGSTPGHLIAVIGYEWEKEVGDLDGLYIFSSDSYSESDATCYRKYKWTELDECWVSRMIYMASAEIDKGAPTEGIPHLPSEIKEEAPGIYSIYYQEEPLDLTDFTLEKTEREGRGVLCYTIEGIEAEEPKETNHSIVYENYQKTLANNTFFYMGINTNENGQITFDPGTALRRAKVPEGEQRKITVYAMFNTGKTYVGELEAVSGS